MSDVIRWEAPPPHRRAGQKQRSKYDAMAAMLRERPGEWALVLEDAPVGVCLGVAGMMRRGVGAFTPAHAFKSRQVGAAGAAKASLYARYVGGAR